MKTAIFWDWFDFGIMLRVYKLIEHSDYSFAIDIQILWLNLWLQIYKK